MDAPRDQRPLGQLFGDLAEQLSTLIRKEMELARTEMTEKVGTVGRDAASIGVGAALAYGGVLVLLVNSGRSALRRVDLAPRRTVETLKDDAQWAKEQVT